MRKIVCVIISLFLLPAYVYGESLDINPYYEDKLRFAAADDQTVQKSGKILSSAAISATEGGDAKVKIEAAKYYLAINPKLFIPFTLTINPQLTSTNKTSTTTDSLLDPSGGLVNISADGSFRLLKKYIGGTSDNDGLWINAGIGAKMVQAISETVNSKYITSEYAKIEPKLILNIFNDKKISNGKAGFIQLGVTCLGSVVNGDNFRDVYGDDAKKVIFNVNWFGAIYITNKIMLSGGSTVYSSNDKVDHRYAVNLSFEPDTLNF